MKLISCNSKDQQYNWIILWLFSELKVAVIEKQYIILHKLTELSYKDLMQLAESLSAIISNLENMYTKSEHLCNKIISEHMLNDHRATFSKAESIMKSSEIYVKSKNIANLKQCASRASYKDPLTILFFKRKNWIRIIRLTNRMILKTLILVCIATADN